MNSLGILSDQSFRWSATYAKEILRRPTKRRQALLGKLPSLGAILRGSLIERYKPCGKPGCKCAKGAAMVPSSTCP